MFPLYLLYFLHIVFSNLIQLFLFLFSEGKERKRKGKRRGIRRGTKRGTNRTKERNYEDDSKVLFHRKLYFILQFTKISFVECFQFYIGEEDVEEDL